MFQKTPTKLPQTQKLTELPTAELSEHRETNLLDTLCQSTEEPIPEIGTSKILIN